MYVSAKEADILLLLVIVNGQRNKVVLDIVNKEKTPYTVFAVTGQVSNADDYTKVVRNVSRPRVLLSWWFSEVKGSNAYQFSLVDCHSLR